MSTKLRVLMLEDSRTDAALVTAELRRAGFEIEVQICDSEPEFLARLNPDLDIILTDFNMPQFSAPRAIELRNQRGLDVPIIVVSGSVGEDTAVEMLKQGAADYLLKDRLARLGAAVTHAVAQRRLRREKQISDVELQRNREFMQRVMDASPGAIFVLDLASRSPVFLSRSIVGALGITPEQALAMGDKFLSDLAHPDDLTAIEETLDRYANDTEGKVVEREFRLKHAQGGWRTIRSSGTVFTRDADGKPSQVVGMFEDVSERRKLEEQLRQSQKMQAIGQLAGGVAHDFNNILTVIVGYSEMLLERLPHDETREMIDEIHQSGERASALTRQLLAFSRKQVLEPKLIDLNQAIRSISNMLSRLIGEDVRLSTALDSKVEQVRVDPGQLEQIIMNLAVNARDAMPDGGNLTIETRYAELTEEYCQNQSECTPGQYVMMSMTDTGCGMSREVADQIFEPFFTTKGVGKGTGLGLSTVHGIVKQSGGHISVYSEQGVGTTFKVYFPTAAKGARPAEEEKGPAAIARGQETILLVEDDEKVRKFTRTMLSSFGYNVLVAVDGPDAIQLAESTKAPIHLLVTDLVMPVMSGVKVAEAIRHRLPTLKALFMSGYTDDAVVRNGLVTSNMIFLQKPFTSADLAQKVRTALHG